MGKKVSPFDVSWVHMGPGVGFSPSQLREGKFVFDRGDGTYKTIKMPFKFGKDDHKDKDKDKDEDKNNGKGNGKGNNGGITDVDFNMQGELRKPKTPTTKGEKIENLIGDTRDPNRFKMGRGIIPKLPTGKTMKQGGLVRGGGCAQRGRGKGKMV